MVNVFNDSQLKQRITTINKHYLKYLLRKMSSKQTRKRKTKSSTTDIPAKTQNIEETNVTDTKPNKQVTRVSKHFFNQPTYELARALLGKILVHDIEGCLVKSVIVETELYPGGNDKASVSYNNRRTKANEPVFGPPGTTWVYLTYGMHHCINISSADHGGAVLLRAGEPIEGIEKIFELRKSPYLYNLTFEVDADMSDIWVAYILSGNLKGKINLKLEDLCSGPAKLCKAMGIDKESCNAINVGDSDKLWLEESFGDWEQSKIVSAKRIGIDRAGEYAVYQLWRFYYLGHPCVSKRDIKCEKELERSTSC